MFTAVDSPFVSFPPSFRALHLPTHRRLFYYIHTCGSYCLSIDPLFPQYHWSNENTEWRIGTSFTRNLNECSQTLLPSYYHVSSFSCSVPWVCPISPGQHIYAKSSVYQRMATLQTRNLIHIRWFAMNNYPQLSVSSSHDQYVQEWNVVLIFHFVCESHTTECVVKQSICLP